MTRETKIGLLVGLAFVIVIGILISDHLSSTNEPGGAPLRATADNVRASLGQMGSDDVAPPLRVPISISPQQPIITTDELNRRHSGPPVVFVNPQPQPQPQPPQPNNNTNGNSTDRLRDIARRNGQDIIPPGGDNTFGNNSAGNNTGNNNTQPPQPPAPKPVARTYEAQPGDSLGAIALKQMGSSCKANRDAIVAANPGLAENRDLIIVGKTYVIPTPGGSASNGIARTPAPPTKPAETTATTVTYVVKSHDTLWSIANNELGSPTAVDAIRQLNQDVLNGSDRLRANMKLKLPAHPAVDRNDVTRND